MTDTKTLKDILDQCINDPSPTNIEAFSAAAEMPNSVAEALIEITRNRVNTEPKPDNRIPRYSVH